MNRFFIYVFIFDKDYDRLINLSISENQLSILYEFQYDIKLLRKRLQIL